VSWELGGFSDNKTTQVEPKGGRSVTRTLLQGFVSKAAPGCGRGAGDRQFFYINGRPVDLPKVSKVLNELYRTFCPAGIGSFLY